MSKLAKGETVEGVALTEEMNQSACFAIMNTQMKDHVAKFHNVDKDRAPAGNMETH